MLMLDRAVQVSRDDPAGITTPPSDRHLTAEGASLAPSGPQRARRGRPPGHCGGPFFCYQLGSARLPEGRREVRVPRY